MAVSTRQGLMEYCLRELGEPVIKVNVAEEQLEDRIDEALSYFIDYHYDGIEKVYLKHQITEQDLANEYLPLSDLVVGVSKVFPIGGLANGSGLFSAKFQLIASSIQNLTSIDLINYETSRQYIQLLDDVLVGHKIFRFNKIQGRLYIDHKWDEEFEVGEWVLVEAYRALDPAEFSKVWNDRWLKLYTTALFKRQWGANVRKFTGVQLPGGVTIDGQGLYDEAISEIKELEDDLMNKSAVLDWFVG